MRELRLLWQVFWAYLAIMVGLIVVLGLYASREARSYYLDRKWNELESGARLVEARVSQPLGQARFADLELLSKQLSRSLGMRVTVILPTGQVVGESSQEPERLENHRNRPEIIRSLAGSVGRSRRFSSTRNEELMYVAVPWKQDRQVAAIIRTSFPIHPLLQTLHVVYLRIAVAGGAATVLVAFASLVVARKIVRPLEVIRGGAKRFASGELEHRLPIRGAEEVRTLAEAMNYMAQELHRRIQTIVSQEREHEAVLSSMDEGVLAVDHTGKILSLNAACGRLLSLDAEQVRGRLVHEVVRTSKLLEFVERTLVSAAYIEEDLELYRPGNRWIHAHGTVLHDPPGNKIGALIVLHDITRLRHLENVRRDFVANVSHELRTPITSIKGFVETLLAEELQDKETSLRFLRIVLKQADRLDAIINDLLLLSRVEKGSDAQTTELDRECLCPVIRSAVEMCEWKAADKQIRIEVACADDITATINAPLLEQAVVNLLDNAIKYSSPGSPVRITAVTNADDVVIRVEDQGCGIESKHLSRLFERFYRVDKARSRELGGTGLGLAIVKHIVAAHRGTVRVQSTVGKGSVFSIHLPAGSPSNQPIPAPGESLS